MVAFFIGNHELHTNPHQQQTTNDFQIRDGQKCQRKNDKQHPQSDGAHSAPHDALHALIFGQLSTGQSDDNRVIAAEQNINQDNLTNRDPKFRG